jgi:ABC-2 type transport system ATP-binding protein
LPTSSEPAVEIDAVAKRYELGELASLGRTYDTVKRRVRGLPPQREYVEALGGVTFTVGRGESFAVLGRNGSGKSTLVSLVSGVTLPSAGRVRVRGTVMPLLSVGAGFNPELTGRENVLLFGSMVGLSRRQILESMDDVADFAEIKRAHMATPTKRYSSGMRARLSFSTALQLPADIYILDEVLAAADDGFKARAAAHFEDLRARGATIIFISHELPLLERICERGVWLQEGRIYREGPITDLAPEYHDYMEEAARTKRETMRGLRPAKPVRRLRAFGRDAS